MSEDIINPILKKLKEKGFTKRVKFEDLSKQFFKEKDRPKDSPLLHSTSSISLNEILEDGISPMSEQCKRVWGLEPSSKFIAEEYDVELIKKCRKEGTYFWNRMNMAQMQALGSATGRKEGLPVILKVKRPKTLRSDPEQTTQKTCEDEFEGGTMEIKACVTFDEVPPEDIECACIPNMKKMIEKGIPYDLGSLLGYIAEEQERVNPIIDPYHFTTRPLPSMLTIANVISNFFSGWEEKDSWECYCKKKS